MKLLNKKGQALVEYVLIIAAVSLVIIGVVSTFGDLLKDKITEMSCTISNQEYIAGEEPGKAPASPGPEARPGQAAKGCPAGKTGGSPGG